MVSGTLVTPTAPASRPLRRVSLIAVLVMLGVAGYLLLARVQPHVQQELGGATMGTHYSVKVVDLPSSVDKRSIAREIAQLLAQINQRLSTYVTDSELSGVNQNTTTDWLAISDEMYQVIAAAQSLSLLSDGAFDITVGPLVNLWGFGTTGTRDTVPAPAQVQQALQRVGHEALSLHQTSPAIRKARGDLYLDLSAIAKGHAVDRIARLLETHRINNYLVEIGGELRAHGHNRHGEPWTIAIEKPVSNQRSVQRLITVGDQAVATSGNYRNYFDHQGRRYSHTIDPRTGEPVTHQLASVTVVHPSAMQADALATAFSVLGPDAGFALAVREKIAALFISAEQQGFSERSTPAFTELVVP